MMACWIFVEPFLYHQLLFCSVLLIAEDRIGGDKWAYCTHLEMIFHPLSGKLIEIFLRVCLVCYLVEGQKN